MRPGIYNIQNLVGQIFVEMQEDLRQPYCGAHKGMPGTGRFLEYHGVAHPSSPFVRILIPEAVDDISPNKS